MYTCVLPGTDWVNVHLSQFTVLWLVGCLHLWHLCSGWGWVLEDGVAGIRLLELRLMKLWWRKVVELLRVGVVLGLAVRRLGVVGIVAVLRLRWSVKLTFVVIVIPRPLNFKHTCISILIRLIVYVMNSDPTSIPKLLWIPHLLLSIVLVHLRQMRFIVRTIWHIRAVHRLLGHVALYWLLGSKRYLGSRGRVDLLRLGASLGLVDWLLRNVDIAAFWIALLHVLRLLLFFLELLQDSLFLLFAHFNFLFLLKLLIRSIAVLSPFVSPFIDWFHLDPFLL